jgi:hypothetical protein
VLVAQNCLFANLDDVEDCITSCELDFDIFVPKTSDYWREDLVEMLSLSFVEESDGNDTEAIESRSPLLRVISFLVMPTSSTRL